MTCNDILGHIRQSRTTLQSLTPKHKPRRIRILYVAVVTIIVYTTYVFGLLLFMHAAKDDNQKRKRQKGWSIDNSPSLEKSILSTKLADLQRFDYEKYTVRMNTFRRNEQLIISLNHHAKCTSVAQIQVIWCDLENEPPMEVLHHPSGKVVVEKHHRNSLNERFVIMSPTPTIGIFSMDDDVLRPCQALDSAFFQWTRNPERMVGFDPRVHIVANQKTNEWQYGALSAAERTGTYSMVLTRTVFIHRDYLTLYVTVLPKSILDTVTDSLNCEDIAMTLLVSTATHGKPPLLANLWARKALVKLYHLSAISGEAEDTKKQEEHRQLRNFCVDSFAQQMNLKSIKFSKLQSNHFLVQYSSKEKFETTPFSDEDTITSPPVSTDLELQLIKEWTSATSKSALLEGWIKTTSFEAKKMGLITHTEEWEKRWNALK